MKFGNIYSLWKTEQWEYKLGRQSINIDIPDLYNYPEFKNRQWYTKIQKELNVLDVDILNSFGTLLNRKWVKLDHQELVRIVDQGWTTHYCTIKQTKDWMRVDLMRNYTKMWKKFWKNFSQG